MRVLSLVARQAAELLLRFKREEARRVVDQIAAKELSHRLKNVLTMVQSIARQSRKTTSSTAEYASAFDERLAALARAHAVLAETDRNSASVRAVIAEQVLPLAAGQFSLEGPDAIVGPDAGYVLALVLHELAVNARKHGALRDQDGRVEINWTLDQGHQLLLHWTERGGKPVSSPVRQGFGTALIDNLVRPADRT
jgi:two-component system CheB/CheR fusion protein